ncbi:hypothetical protein CV044_12095 [Achromobacter ruhlandii]|nr:hypothetical protein CV044_12095 [Achromobacter ruhlandii]
MYHVLECATFEVHVFCSSKDDFSFESQVMNYLKTHHDMGDKAIKGVRAVLRRFAELGQNGLTREAFHEVDRDEKIWEFSKGDHRIFCFLIGKAVVLTNAAMKKGQKVDPAEVKKAISARAIYQQFRGSK